MNINSAKPFSPTGKPVQYPDKPILNICNQCSKEYTNADVRNYDGVQSFHCPNCGALLEKEKVVAQLNENLRQNFEAPLNKLNNETQVFWKSAIEYAKYGFIVRLLLSVIIFVIGSVLLLISSWRIIFGQLTLEQFWGPGITFTSGLGAMLIVVYRGPLREIRQSISDLGIANAAFIAYIHQILQISHTYSFYYLNQKISFEEMQRSSELIRAAMKETVAVLSVQKSEELLSDFEKSLPSVTTEQPK